MLMPNYTHPPIYYINNIANTISISHLELHYDYYFLIIEKCKKHICILKLILNKIHIALKIKIYLIKWFD